MPFQSKAQMRFLFAQHPDIAKRWAAMGVPASLPARKQAAAKAIKK